MPGFIVLKKECDTVNSLTAAQLRHLFSVGGSLCVRKIGNDGAKNILNGSLQDGAYIGDYCFRFTSKGHCTVSSIKDHKIIDRFTLDRTSEICPHSNAVFFGREKPAETDEFPLLYTNVYNNYRIKTNRREGELLAYRILRENGHFTSQLIQLIRIGFVQDTKLWLSEDTADTRPYGNFIYDEVQNRLYAYTMRDKEQETRFFGFDMPSVSDGVMTDGILTLTIPASKIVHDFAVPYFRYIQGADAHNGLLISSEGFRNNKTNRPVLRFIDLPDGKLIGSADLLTLGFGNEPEMLAHTENGEFYYSDADGNIFAFSEG